MVDTTRTSLDRVSKKLPSPCLKGRFSLLFYSFFPTFCQPRLFRSSSRPIGSSWSDLWGQDCKIRKPNHGQNPFQSQTRRKREVSKISSQLTYQGNVNNPVGGFGTRTLGDRASVGRGPTTVRSPGQIGLFPISVCGQ